MFRILKNPEVHHCVYNSLPALPILYLISPLRVLLPYPYNIHFSTIIRPKLWSSKFSLSSRFPTINLYVFSLPLLKEHAPHQSHHANNILFPVSQHIIKFLIMYISAAPLRLQYSQPNPLLSYEESNFESKRNSVFFILIFILWKSRKCE